MLLTEPANIAEKTSDSTALRPEGAMQRARGAGHVSFKRRDDMTVLDRLRQSGCAKIRLPKIHDSQPVAVLLNTAGGITGGDKLHYCASWGEKSRAMVTNQTAERIYRRSQGLAEVTNTLSVADGANAEWLPQETIVFDRSGLKRRLTARLYGSARLLALECVVLGRKAMGETVNTLDFHDSWRIYRDDTLAFADDTRLNGDATAILSGPATGNGAHCFATLIDIGPHAMERLDFAREQLGKGTCGAGASAWNGILLMRFIANDSRKLRDDLTTFLQAYRGEDMPRVWHC